MNIYNLHGDPETLLHYDEAYEKLPALIWDKYEDQPEELKKREKALAKDPRYAYSYARNILKGPFKAGEVAITKSEYYARLYAKFVLKGHFTLTVS